MVKDLEPGHPSGTRLPSKQNLGCLHLFKGSSILAKGRLRTAAATDALQHFLSPRASNENHLAQKPPQQASRLQNCCKITSDRFEFADFTRRFATGVISDLCRNLKAADTIMSRCATCLKSEMRPSIRQQRFHRRQQ